MPEEVNIDELLDLKTDEERRQRLQVPVCPSSPPVCRLSLCPHPSVCSSLPGHLSLVSQQHRGKNVTKAGFIRS